MADVTRLPAGRGESDAATRARGDRAQLIIVTGLAIGVTLIALVVILNTVIYTENLATRSAGVGGQQAVQYRATAMEATGGVMDHENREDYADQANATANVTHGVNRVDRFLRLQHVEDETVAEVTNVAADDGAIVRQTDDSRLYVDNSFSAGTWDVVTGAGDDDVRQFDLTVNTSTIDSNATDPSSAFNVTVIDGTNEWRLSVYDAGSGLELAVHNGSQSGATRGVCGSPYAVPNVTVDLTGGAVEGESCPPIEFGKGLSGSMDVQFERPTHAGGTYNLTINESGGATPGFGLNPPPSTSSPYFAEAVYSLRFEVHYQQPRLVYHDRVRVAPGEPS